MISGSSIISIPMTFNAITGAMFSREKALSGTCAEIWKGAKLLGYQSKKPQC